MRSSTGSVRCAGRSSISPNRTRRRSCRGTPICRSRSPSLSATICSPTKRCSRATPSGFRDCRRRVNRLPLGSAALAGTSFPIDRERVATELGFEALCANSLDAVSDRDFADRIHRRGRVDDDPRVAVCRGARVVDEPALRVRRARGSVLHRLVDHAAEEEPGRRGACARQDRTRERPSRRAAHADEGPAARLQPRQPGGQGAAVRHRRHARRHAGDHDRSRRRRDRRQRLAHARSRGRRPRRPPPTSPTTWCARACRFATRTKPSRGRCVTPSSGGVELAALPLAELQSFAPEIGADVHARADARRIGREPQPSRRHGARAGARGRRRRAARARL